MTDGPRFFVQFPPDAVRIQLPSGTEAVICVPDPVPHEDRAVGLPFPDGWVEIGFIDKTGTP